jgi:hypothetical protein
MLGETHEGQVAVMLHHLGAGRGHAVASPSAYLQRRIGHGEQLAHQVAPVQVATGFTGDDVDAPTHAHSQRITMITP